jgi:hypothetical protein
LEPLAQREVEEHLERCEACRAEVDGLRHLWGTMLAVPVETPDSVKMRSRFAAMLDSAAPVDAITSGRGAGIWKLAPALQLGLALALVAVGIAIGLRIGPATTAEPLPEVRELRTELRETREMVLSLMQMQSASERLLGVNWSNQISQPDSPVLSALIEAVKHDPSVNVRLASVSALEKFGKHDMVRQGLLEALEQQESPVVQAALIDVVVALRETGSIGILQKLAGDSAVHESVRKQARWALELLT